jgi:chemotaxis protein methyltransferase WspC
MNTPHDRVVPRPEQALVTLLEQWIGLDAQTLGSAAIARAVRVRREACGEADDSAFLARLARDAEERVRLIDEVVVPESWFFRDPQVFEFLQRFAATFASAPGQTPIRILCVPCAAGQEPYSVAMALFEAGLSAPQFRVDAADVSRTALEQATAATYSANAFRGADVAFRERWFQTKGTDAELVSTVRTQVQFFQGNLLDESFAADRDPYDVVFCRNLLIYLTPDARRRAEEAIDRLLAPDGLLVLGAAEPPILQGRWIPAAGTSAFTLRRGTRSSEGVLANPAALQPLRAQAQDRGVSVMAIPPTPAAASREAVEPGPSGVDLLLREAGRLANDGRHAEALAVCQRHQQDVGPDARVFFLMGMLHQFTGDLDRAEACLHKTLYLDPNHDEALLSLANVAAERGDRGMADRYRQSAARVHARKGSS